MVTSHPTHWCNIKRVDCGQNVILTLYTTGVDMSNLPSTLRCGQIDVRTDYTRPLNANNVITLSLGMYRPANPKGVIF